MKSTKVTVKNKLLNKIKNKDPIRVLYKTVGNMPNVKIIDNVQRLKRVIVQNNLQIIPYQNVYIICYSKETMKNMPINIILDLMHISGDFIVVDIDKKKREFKSLSQENIIWFTEDLANKSLIKNISNNYRNSIKAYLPKTGSNEYVPDNNNFEVKLINILTDIELTLASLLTNI